MKTTTTWKTDNEFESDNEGNLVRLDGDRKNGFSPKALLLSGLASCSGIDVVDILRKMKVPFSGLVIEVEADQTEEHPRVFKEIMMTFHIKSDNANSDKIRKAIDLSLDKYCGVAAMLKKNSPINYNLVVS